MTGFGTSISSWVVPLDTLMPFSATPSHEYRANDLVHLKWPSRESGTFDISLSATIILKFDLIYPTFYS